MSARNIDTKQQQQHHNRNLLCPKHTHWVCNFAMHTFWRYYTSNYWDLFEMMVVILWTILRNILAIYFLIRIKNACIHNEEIWFKSFGILVKFSICNSLYSKLACSLMHCDLFSASRQAPNHSSFKVSKWKWTNVKPLSFHFIIIASLTMFSKL